MWRALAVVGLVLFLGGAPGFSDSASATSLSATSVALSRGVSGSAAGLRTSSEDGKATVCSVEVPCATVELGPDVWQAAMGFALVMVVGVLLLAVIAVRLLTR